MRCEALSLDSMELLVISEGGHVLAEMRLSHWREGCLNARFCDSTILPSVILGACDREVYGVIGANVEVIGERERNSLGLVCKNLGLATFWPDDHQSEIGVADVKIARFGMEAESQGSSTDVL